MVVQGHGRHCLVATGLEGDECCGPIHLLREGLLRRDETVQLGQPGDVVFKGIHTLDDASVHFLSPLTKQGYNDKHLNRLQMRIKSFSH